MTYFDRAVAFERCKNIRDDMRLIEVEAENGEVNYNRILVRLIRDVEDLADICAGLLRTTPDTQ